MNSLRECIRAAAEAQSTWQRFYISSQRQLATRSFSDTDGKTILIIGRPNVGKSTLFNRLIGRRHALVHDTPSSHVTRDYKEGLAQFSDLKFRVIDTSGLEPAMSTESVQGRATRITKQLLERADGILFVTDSRSPLTTADQEAADWLRRSLKSLAIQPAQTDVTPRDSSSLSAPQASLPVTVVANKCDNIGNSALVASAFEAVALGLGDPVLYSAETQAGTADLYDALKHLLESTEALKQGEAGSRMPLPRDSAPQIASTAQMNSDIQTQSSQSQPHRDVKQDAVQGSVEVVPPKQGSTATIDHSSVSSVSEGSQPESQHQQDQGQQLADEGQHHQGQGQGQQESVLGKTEPIKLVLVGLPNAGKSTLLNRLLGFERALTGSEPALTRDAVVADLDWRGWQFEITDTAGWLKRSTLQHYDENGGKVAAMTVSQGQAKVNFGHAVVLLVDAVDAHTRVAAARLGIGTTLSRRELALAGTVLDEGRLLVIALNKADALDAPARQKVLDALNHQIDTSFASWRDCMSIAWVSGSTGKGVSGVLRRITELIPLWSTVPTTLQLNAWRKKMAMGLAGCGKQALTSLRFLKAEKTRPPTIMAEFRGRIVDKNFPQAVARSIRSSFGMHGIPIRVVPIAKIRNTEVGQTRVLRTHVQGTRLARKDSRHFHTAIFRV